MRGTNGKSNDGGGDENEIHDDKDGLELSHNLGHDGGQDGMAEDASEEGPVDCSVGGCPIAVAGDDDDGKEHQRKSIYF